MHEQVLKSYPECCYCDNSTKDLKKMNKNKNQNGKPRFYNKSIFHKKEQTANKRYRINKFLEQ